METLETSDELRAWVGCLGCYSAGRLVGSWLTCDQISELPANCSRCGSDEWWVMDHDLSDGGEMSPAEFVRRVEFLNGLDDCDSSGRYSAGLDHVLAYWDNVGWEYAPEDPEEAFRAAADLFMFECETQGGQRMGFALADFMGYDDDGLPDWVRVDWDAIGDDVHHIYNVCEMRDGGWAVFSHG